MAALIMVAALLIIGAGIGFWVGRASSKQAKRAAELQNQVNELEAHLDYAKQQHASYQTSVTEHFQKTAVMFTELSQQYRGVYQHLAAGAQALCQDGSLYEQLKLFKDETVQPIVNEANEVAEEFVPVYSEDFAVEKTQEREEDYLAPEEEEQEYKEEDPAVRNYTRREPVLAE